jgi:hypothetical protein
MCQTYASQRGRMGQPAREFIKNHTRALKNVKEEEHSNISETPIVDCDDPRTVFVLLKTRGLPDTDAWKGVGGLMQRIQAVTKDRKLGVIAAYTPQTERETTTIVADSLGKFTESLGPDIQNDEEEILGLYSRHRQVQARIHPNQEDERFPIPTRAQQLLRCCALNIDLVDWCQTKFNDQQYDHIMIRKWFSDKPERLEGTGLTVEELCVDHIVPSCLGGASYIYNYALVPKRVGSKFKERFEDFKRAYLGRQTVEIALGFAQWVCVRADIRFSQFNVANFMINESPRKIRPKKSDQVGLRKHVPLNIGTENR